MLKKSDQIIVEELRNRINDLSIVNGELYFLEISRLVSWMNNIPSFRKPLLFLDYQKRSKYKQLFTILRDLSIEGKHIWIKIKEKVPFPLENTPEYPKQALAKLKQYYDMDIEYNTINIYHQLRILIEYLATTSHSKIISDYYCLHTDTKIPLIRGRIYDLFIDYGKIEGKIKLEASNTAWGSWENLKQVSYLSQEYDSIYQLKEWSKVFSKEEYFVHLHKVLNHLFDWIFLNQKEEINVDDPLLDYAVWNEDFTYDNNIFKVGIYGEVTFNPDRSPWIGGKNERSKTDCFVEALVGAKDIGIDQKSLIDKARIDKRDLKSFVNSKNDVFENARKRGKVQADIRISKIGKNKNSKYRILVIPIEEDRNPSPVIS